MIIILGLLVFILVGAVENYRKFRFKRKKLQEEARLKDELADIKIKNQIQEERLRISRDLHDNIGFALAYCDNDKSEHREHFIGSVAVEGENKNKGWIDAHIFGTLLLVD